MTEASSSSFGGGCPSSRGTRLALTIVVGLAGAGCGAASRAAPKAPAYQRVCARAQQATRAVLGPVVLRIADSDPANIECVLQRTGIRVDAVAQAATQAWTQYDTAVVHQSQAYGSGPTFTPSQLPQNVSIRGAQASWIPAQNELIATNGTESTAGSYVTVTLKGKPARGIGKEALARGVAAAVLAVAPRGPSPGPAPS